jgi:hypothetical protein
VTSAVPQKHNLDRRAPTILEKMRDASDDTLLNTNEVSEWFDVSEEWLEIGRSRGWGPEFVKMGPRLVRYTVGACRQYLAKRTYAGTADYPPTVKKLARVATAS